jgi:hypothetical protein
LYEGASSEATSSEAAYLYLCAKADKGHFPPPRAVAPPLLRQAT